MAKAILTSLLCAGTIPLHVATQEKPNILFILADILFTSDNGSVDEKTVAADELIGLRIDSGSGAQPVGLKTVELLDDGGKTIRKLDC